MLRSSGVGHARPETFTKELSWERGAPAVFCSIFCRSAIRACSRDRSDKRSASKATAARTASRAGVAALAKLGCTFISLHTFCSHHIHTQMARELREVEEWRQ